MDGGAVGQSSPTTGIQLTPTGELTNRRSFPALELINTQLRDGRRSFPALESHEPIRRLHAVVGPRRLLANRETVAGSNRQPVFVFEEYNSMTKKKKLTLNMEDYLKEREGWTMMVLKRDVLKTIRFEHIVDHMRRANEEAGERKYFLIARHYTEQFRTRYINSLRPV
jgi:hypothetical protein